MWSTVDNAPGIEATMLSLGIAPEASSTLFQSCCFQFFFPEKDAPKRVTINTTEVVDDTHH